MKIVDVAEQHPPFDVPSGLAESLIAAGTHKQFISSKPKTIQRLTWRACRGARIEDVLDAPFIAYKCDGCGNNGQMSGPTCHRTQTVRCCGVSTKVPDGIAKQFVQFRQEWEPKHKKYVDAVRRNLADQEKTRKAVVETENLRLATQLRTGTNVTAIES
jgi:hypothetical protein